MLIPCTIALLKNGRMSLIIFYRYLNLAGLFFLWMVFMRKIRCTLILAFAILVASCSNLITNTTSGISFSLDSSVVNSVQETIVRSGIIQGSDNVSITCNISECLEGLKKI